MSTLINGSDFLEGFLSRDESVGGSVASARAAKVSMIKLTQSSWTAERIDPSEDDAMAETKVRRIAATLTDNWNWTNFRTESLTHRPVLMATTMLEKESSIKIISEAVLATSVPLLGQRRSSEQHRNLRDTHGETDVCELKSRSIIRTITSNSNNLSLILQSLYQ